MRTSCLALVNTQLVFFSRKVLDRMSRESKVMCEGEAMPTDRKQINVRVDAETEALMIRLIPVVSAAIGLKVNQSDLFRLGLVALRKQYLPDDEDEKPTAVPTTERPSAKKRKK
jgi:hypothetical protein